MIKTELSFFLDKMNRLDIIIPFEPQFAIDEVEIWLVGANMNVCLFKDSWESVFLPEVTHVVSRFRNHTQQNCYPPTELEYRYFRHLTSGEIDNALWDYLLLSYQNNHVFLAEYQNGETVLIVSEMMPFTEAPQYRQTACFKIDRPSFLKWFDNLVIELNKCLPLG